MNRYSRLASKWGYYRYLTNYTPSQLNRYQSGFNYEMGRAGLFHILVYRFAAIHMTIEERISPKMITPTVVTNLAQRLTMYWFLMGCLVFSFYLGDMGTIMNPTRMSVPNRIADDGEIPMRYESVYLHDRLRKSVG